MNDVRRSHMSDEEMRSIVEKHIHSLLGIEVIDYFLRSHRDILKPEQIARGVGRPPDEVRRVIHEMVELEVLRPIKGGGVAYRPADPLRTSLDRLASEWHNPRQRHKLMRWIQAWRASHSEPKPTWWMGILHLLGMRAAS